MSTRRCAETLSSRVPGDLGSSSPMPQHGVLRSDTRFARLANRLGDAMAAWESARAVAQRANRRDMLWKTMANSASTQAKMDLVEQAAQLAEQAHQIACASNETVSMRVLQMQVTLAHRLRDVGRYGRALELLDEALAGYAASGASHSDFALAEQRLVVLYQRLASRHGAAPARARSPPAPNPASATAFRPSPAGQSSRGAAT